MRGGGETRAWHRVGRARARSRCPRRPGRSLGPRAGPLAGRPLPARPRHSPAPGSPARLALPRAGGQSGTPAPRAPAPAAASPPAGAMGCEVRVSGLLRRNLQPTLTYWSVFFSFGLCIAFLGPTLLDLRCQTRSSLPEISWVFFSQQLCLLLGSALGGVFKRT